MSVGFAPALAQSDPTPSPTQTPPADRVQSEPAEAPVSNTMTGNTSASATALSPEQQRQWNTCKSKSATAMMKVPECVTLMQSHPELQKDSSRPK